MDPAKYMEIALSEARKGGEVGEVPVGAVVVLDGKVLASAHNEVERLNDVTAHAEILAIRRASSKLSNWRLLDAKLFVTLEPCPMCIGAMLLARIKDLYYGCYDPRQGAAGSVFDLSNILNLPHRINVYPELLAKDSQLLLQEFFAKKRKQQ